MKKTISLLFFGLICWMIYIADTNENHILLKIAEEIPYGDKVNHFFLFGALAFMLNITFPKTKLRSIGFGTIFVSFFCILEESSQIMFATRSFDLVDLLFDFIGITVFSYLSLKWISWETDKKPGFMI